MHSLPCAPTDADLGNAARAFAQVMGVPALRMDAVVPQGSVNWTFSATTSNSRFAVRMNRTRSALDAHAEYVKERWCIDAARRAGIPTSSVHDVGRDDRHAWMIQE